MVGVWCQRRARAAADTERDEQRLARPTHSPLPRPSFHTVSRSPTRPRPPTRPQRTGCFQQNKPSEFKPSQFTSSEFKPSEFKRSEFLCTRRECHHVSRGRLRFVVAFVTSNAFTSSGRCPRSRRPVKTGNPERGAQQIRPHHPQQTLAWASCKPWPEPPCKPWPESPTNRDLICATVCAELRKHVTSRIACSNFTPHRGQRLANRGVMVL